MVQGKYKVLLIGCGNMGALNDAPGSGNEHKTISYAKALKEHGAFEVFYYDEDGSKVNKAIEIWGGNWCNNDEVDVVIIATPDKTHYDILSKEIHGKPKLVI
jgi:predicted dehydrogenase